jgi:hypothetical protein
MLVLMLVVDVEFGFRLSMLALMVVVGVGF